MQGKIVIVGCGGRMGAMFMRKARKAGVDVTGLDQPLLPQAVREACENAKLVLLCVPVGAFSSTLEIIVPEMPPNAILSDITSVKEVPMRLMEQAFKGNIVGTHPLFGPKHGPDDVLKVALVPGKTCSPQALNVVGSFFTELGCEVFETTAARHDEAMARIQNMNFITNLAYFAVLAEQDELLPFLTPSFERRKKSAAKMLTEDASMFSGLFEANPHSQDAVRQYRKMLNIAASGDIEVLTRRAQWWWPDQKDNLE